MLELGYTYGEHFVTEPRGADGRPERFAALATELVSLKVDVIVAAGPALPALKKATSTIPVVMAAVDDPVGSGYVESLARPGGTSPASASVVESFTESAWSCSRKLSPGDATVAALWEGSPQAWQAAEAAAQARGWKLMS